ncbi:MAG TPA: hypothetical protein DDZ80_01000 [Cyanobacteria bacterium UBA8803]|nr:hypothetical protein [Cyanobacteria bacterium UBA8803]
MGEGESESCLSLPTLREGEPKSCPPLPRLGEGLGVRAFRLICKSNMLPYATSYFQDSHTQTTNNQQPTTNNK